MSSGVSSGSVPSGPETVTAERFVAGGRVLARHPDGRIVLVRGALPGELVSVGAPTRRGGAELADAVSWQRVADDRVRPPCPRRREGCGGCDWQHLDEAAQLGAKAEVVADALRRIGGLSDATVVPGGGVDPRDTRTTIRVVGRGDGSGFRREDSHEVVDARGCLVAHPLLRELLDGLVIRPGLDVTLRCSVASGARCATWDGPADAVSGLAPDVAIGQTARVTEVVHHAPTARDAVRRSPAGAMSDGASLDGASLDSAMSSTRLEVSAGSFFQSGPTAAGLLVDAVTRAAPELAAARGVVDLYAGVGLFAAAVGPSDARLVLVESSRHAVRDARRNLADHPDARVVRADVARWDPRRSGLRRADVVIADPPRSGLGRRGAAVVAGTGATTVVLVSCDPVAAARDARLLTDLGYQHVGVEVLDLFPWTHHVETVTRYVAVDLRPA